MRQRGVDTKRDSLLSTKELVVLQATDRKPEVRPPPLSHLIFFLLFFFGLWVLGLDDCRCFRSLHARNICIVPDSVQFRPTIELDMYVSLDFSRNSFSTTAPLDIFTVLLEIALRCGSDLWVERKCLLVGLRSIVQTLPGLFERSRSLPRKFLVPQPEAQEMPSKEG